MLVTFEMSHKAKGVGRSVSGFEVTSFAHVFDLTYVMEHGLQVMTDHIIH